MEGAVNTTFSLICWKVLTRYGGAMSCPMRQPVMVKFLEKLLMVMVRSRMPGRETMGTKGCW